MICLTLTYLINQKERKLKRKKIRISNGCAPKKKLAAFFAK